MDQYGRTALLAARPDRRRLGRCADRRLGRDRRTGGSACVLTGGSAARLTGGSVATLTGDWAAIITDGSAAVAATGAGSGRGTAAVTTSWAGAGVVSGSGARTNSCTSSSSTGTGTGAGSYTSCSSARMLQAGVRRACQPSIAESAVHAGLARPAPSARRRGDLGHRLDRRASGRPSARAPCRVFAGLRRGPAALPLAHREHLRRGLPYGHPARPDQQRPLAAAPGVHRRPRLRAEQRRQRPQRPLVVDDQHDRPGQHDRQTERPDRASRARRPAHRRRAG